MENCVDPDETVHFEPFHQKLHFVQNILVCRAEMVNVIDEDKYTLRKHAYSNTLKILPP